MKRKRQTPYGGHSSEPSTKVATCLLASVSKASLGCDTVSEAIKSCASSAQASKVVNEKKLWSQSFGATVDVDEVATFPVALCHAGMNNANSVLKFSSGANLLISGESQNKSCPLQGKRCDISSYCSKEKIHVAYKCKYLNAWVTTDTILAERACVHVLVCRTCTDKLFSCVESCSSPVNEGGLVKSVEISGIEEVCVVPKSTENSSPNFSDIAVIGLPSFLDNTNVSVTNFDSKFQAEVVMADLSTQSDSDPLCFVDDDDGIQFSSHLPMLTSFTPKAVDNPCIGEAGIRNLSPTKHGKPYDPYLTAESDGALFSDNTTCSSETNSSSDHFTDFLPMLTSPVMSHFPLNAKTRKTLKFKSSFTHSRSLRRSPRAAAAKTKLKASGSSTLDETSWSYLRQSLSTFAYSKSQQQIDIPAYNVGISANFQNSLTGLDAFAEALELLPSVGVLSFSSNSLSEVTVVGSPHDGSSSVTLLFQDATVSPSSDIVPEVTHDLTVIPVVSLPVIVPDAVCSCSPELLSTSKNVALVSPAVSSPSKLLQQSCLGGMDFGYTLPYSSDCFSVGGEENFEPDYDFDEEKCNELLGDFPSELTDRQPTTCMPGGLLSPLKVTVISVSSDNLRTVSFTQADALTYPVAPTALLVEGEQGATSSVTDVKRISIKRPGKLSTANMPLKRKRSWRPSSSDQLSNSSCVESVKREFQQLSDAVTVSPHQDYCELLESDELQVHMLENDSSVVVQLSVDLELHELAHTVLVPVPVEVPTSAITEGDIHEDEEYLEGDWSPAENEGSPSCSFWEESAQVQNPVDDAVVNVDSVAITPERTSDSIPASKNSADASSSKLVAFHSTMAVSPKSEHSSHPVTADSFDKSSGSTFRKGIIAISKVIRPRSSPSKISATCRTDSESIKAEPSNTFPTSIPDKAYGVLGYDDIEEFTYHDTGNCTATDLALQLKARPRSVASHPENGFVLQADMSYENDFVSEVDVPSSARLGRSAVASFKCQNSDQISSDDRRKLTPGKKRRARDALESSWNDTESVKSCASFVRSRAATVRLAAERLNAVQGKASRVTSVPQDTNARLMKFYGDYKEYDKLCELVLGQRNSTEKRWSKEVIKTLTDVFVDSSKSSTWDKFDEFMTKLRRSSFSFDERQYCILFVGVHVMQCLVTQNKWHSANKILEVLINYKVPIHRLSSDALRNCESTKLAVKICFKLKCFNKLSEMLVNLKYFKDSSAVSKRVGSLNVVLVESLKEVTTTSYKSEVCEIAFNLLRCIVSSYGRDKEMREFVDGKFLDLKSFAVFSSLSAGLECYDLLLQFCRLQADHSALLNWMSLPTSLPQIIKRLASSPDNLCLIEAVRLAKLAADQEIYPPIIGGERLVLSSAMSKEEIIVMLVAHLREEAEVRHAASKSLVGPYSFSVHFIPTTNDEYFDPDNLADCLNNAVRETFLVGELRNTSERSLSNSFYVELSDFYSVVKRLTCDEVGTKCFSSSGSSSVSRSPVIRHDLIACNNSLGSIPSVRKQQSGVDSPLGNINRWPTMPPFGNRLKKDDKMKVPHSSMTVPTPKPPSFAIPKVPPPRRKVLLQTPKSLIAAPVLLQGAHAVPLLTHGIKATDNVSVNDQFGSVQLQEVMSGNSAATGFELDSSSPRQSTQMSGSSITHCVPSLLSLNCRTPKNCGSTKDVWRSENILPDDIVERESTVLLPSPSTRRFSGLGASATIPSVTESEIGKSVSMEFPKRKTAVKQPSNHRSQNVPLQSMHQNESCSRVSPNQQLGSSCSAVPGRIKHSVEAFKLTANEHGSMPPNNGRWPRSEQPGLVTGQMLQQAQFGVQRQQLSLNQPPELTKQQIPSRSLLQQNRDVNSIVLSEQLSRLASQQLHQSQQLSSQPKNVPWSQKQIVMPLAEQGKSFKSQNQEQYTSSASQIRNTSCSFSPPMCSKRQSWPLAQKKQPVASTDLEQPGSSMRQESRLASEQHRLEQVPWFSSEQQNTASFAQQSPLINCEQQVEWSASQLSEETYALTQRPQPRLLSGQRLEVMSSTRKTQQTSSLDKSQRSWSLQHQPEQSVQHQQIPGPSLYEQQNTRSFTNQDHLRPSAEQKSQSWMLQQQLRKPLKEQERPGMSSWHQLSDYAPQGQPHTRPVSQEEQKQFHREFDMQSQLDAYDQNQVICSGSKSSQEQSALENSWQQNMSGSLKQKQQNLTPSPQERLNTLSQASPLPFAAGHSQFGSSINSTRLPSTPRYQSSQSQSSFQSQSLSRPFFRTPRQQNSQAFLPPPPGPPAVLRVSKAQLPAQHTLAKYVDPALTDSVPAAPRQTSRGPGTTLLPHNSSACQPTLPVASRDTAASFFQNQARPSGPRVAVQNMASETAGPSAPHRSVVNPTRMYLGQQSTVGQYSVDKPATENHGERRNAPTMPSPSTTSGGTRVYRAIAEEVSERVKEHVRNGVITLSDVALSEFVSIIAGNFYEQCRRESSTGTVVLSDATFDSLERHIDSQVELRRQHTKFIQMESGRRY